MLKCQITLWPRFIVGSLLSNLLSVLLAILSFSAHADVWGYLDDKGTPHFAADQLDKRYELFFRSNAPSPFSPVAVSSSLGEAPAAVWAEALPRPVGVPKLPSKLLAFFEVSSSYKGVRYLMRDAASTYNIDLELLQALIATESGFDSQAVSPRGAVGLMQIMPTTAGRYGVVPDAKTPVEKKLTDPQTNIKTGSRYLRYLINRFPGQLELALAAYNAGEGAVQRAGNTIPKYKETQDYVKTVMQLYTMLKPPSALAEARRLQALPSGRIWDELPGGLPGALQGLPPGAPVAGGARGRGNIMAPLMALDTPSARSGAVLNFEP